MGLVGMHGIGREDCIGKLLCVSPVMSQHDTFFKQWALEICMILVRVSSSGVIFVVAQSGGVDGDELGHPNGGGGSSGPSHYHCCVR